VAYEISNYSVKVTLVAAADLSTNQYNFVKLDSDGNAAAVAATSDQAIGVLQNDPLLGQEAEVLVIGGSKLVAGGAVTEGALVGTSAAGKGSALTPSGTAGASVPRFFGVALTEASAANELFTVLVNCATPPKAI
jgi:hypothetical protein